MTPDLIEELRKEEPSEFHEEILNSTRALIKMSRSEMSKYYDQWDHQDMVYRGEREPDREDFAQELRGKPVKMVIPNTFAQTMTFTSFLFLMYNQNAQFYELSAKGQEDFGTKKDDCETVLNRDWRFNEGNTLLFQSLLNTARFGTGIMECCWTRKLSRVFVPGQETMQTVMGVEVPVRGESAWEDIVKYEGNLVRSVSPYRFFPDTRHPLVDFKKGEFCGAEEDYSMSQLRELESVGEVAGVKHIQPMPRGLAAELGAMPRAAGYDANANWLKFDPNRSESTALVTKVQRWIVPAKFKFGSPERKLGPEEFPVLYHIWYANNNRVIRCEPAYWWHNEFGWAIGQFTPDMHRTVTLGLADLIYRLQDVISWFVNSHIASVRRVIQNRNLINPSAIDTTSLDGEGDIYLRKGVSVPLDRAMMQMRVQDVTGGHMQDVDTLGKIMELVTGVNGNAMGQYNSGRRSAQEARVVTAGAAGRMKMHGHLLWESCYGRLGRLMLSNSRQNLPEEEFAHIIGQGANDPNRFLAFAGTPQEIVRGSDYLTFDSTLSSEKGFMAQSLQELLGVIIQSDPMAARALSMKLDPMKIVDEIQSLRGGGPTARFAYSPEEQMMMQQMMMAQRAAAAAQPQPAAA